MYRKSVQRQRQWFIVLDVQELIWNGNNKFRTLSSCRFYLNKTLQCFNCLFQNVQTKTRSFGVQVSPVKHIKDALDMFRTNSYAVINKLKMNVILVRPHLDSDKGFLLGRIGVPNSI